MIQIHENTNWLAQYVIPFDRIAYITLIVSALLAFASLVICNVRGQVLSEKVVNGITIILGLSLLAFIVSFVWALFILGPSETRYSGSAYYTVEHARSHALGGQQTIVVNDGEKNVDLDAENDDEVHYSKGDKVRVFFRSNEPSKQGKHHLGDITEERSMQSMLFRTSYKVEKIE